MTLLLDTHVLLWWLDENSSLSKPAGDAIADPKNLVLVSAVSIWEIMIKQALGKLSIPPDFRQVLSREPFQFLDVIADHAYTVGELPSHHRDPIDRMLIAQCAVEGLTRVSRDDIMSQYGIPVLTA